jgi:hypothetical protein
MVDYGRFLEYVAKISNYIIVPEFALLPASNVIQQLKSLSDFLMFPLFLALIPQDHFTGSASSGVPDRKIIRVMQLFIAVANEAHERSRSSSDALKYSFENWVHLLRTPSMGRYSDPDIPGFLESSPPFLIRTVVVFEGIAVLS